MLKLKMFISGCLMLLLTGCASFGPLGTSNFEPKLRQDIPSLEGQIIYQAPASFLNAVDGYKFSDLGQLRPQYEPLKYGTAQIYQVGEGIIVLTEHKVYFVKWRGEKYENYWELDYKKITTIEIRSLGLGRRLVIEFDDVPYVVSFDVATDSGQRIDQQRTITVCQLIAQHSKGDCKLPSP
jgi:hypothetical protein